MKTILAGFAAAVLFAFIALLAAVETIIRGNKVLDFDAEDLS